MKLIEADKVEQVIKDYFKAQVDKAFKLTDENEANNHINRCLEHNHDLLKAIDELPSVQSDDDRLERCRFEYVNACKILAHRTPDTSYKDGLNDAWEAAREIYLPEDHGGLGYDVRMKIFNTDNMGWLFKNLSAHEAVEKIRQYEQEQEEIKVGDEVVGVFSDGSETRPFVFIRGSKEYYFGLYSDTGEFCQGGMNMRKTGRHFPEIAAVLEKMRGEQK